MYDLIGLEDYAEYSMRDMGEKYDDDDISEFMIGHRLVKYQGEETEVFIVSVRGTNGTVKEWSSNFDVGSKDDVYWDYDNPEWTNAEHHKGFDVAANRCYELIIKYISNGIASGKIDPTAKKSIFITGHSRGAAISNLLGKIFEDDNNYISSTYGFATPNTTTSSDADTYKTIFSVVNEDDLVPYLPLSEWGFTKYGIIKSASVEEDFENHLGGAQEGTWEWLINANRKDGLDYNANNHKNDTLEAFAKVASTIEKTTSEEIRKSLYIKPYSDKSYLELDKKYESKSEALAKAQDIKNDYGKRLSRACEVSVSTVTTGIWPFKKTVYKIKIAQSPEFLMMTVAALAAGDNPQDNDLIVKVGSYSLGCKVASLYEDAKTQFIHSAIDSISDDGVLLGGIVRFGGMVHGHWPETYYLLSKFLK